MQALIVGATLKNYYWLNKLVDKYDYKIAVDKGAESFYYAKILPDLIMGDFDSIDQNILADFNNYDVKIQAFNIDKDKSDLELAIEVVKDYDRIDFTGVLGGSVSHELFNFNILNGLKTKNKKVSIREANTRIDFLSDGEILKIPKGLRVSIIPTEDEKSCVTLKGFKWNLNKKILKKASTLTLSNETVDTAYVKNIGENIMVVIEPLEIKTR